MKKRDRILCGLGALLLGASLAVNFVLLGRAGIVKKIARRAAPAAEKCAARPAAAAEREKGGAPPGSRSVARLPATPVLFRSAEWSDGEVVLAFESESRLLTASLAVSPEIPVRSRISGAKIRVSGAFLPGMKYRFTVAAGARNGSGGVLEKDAVAELTIPDSPPTAAFVTSGMYLPVNGKKLVLPYRTVNCDKVEVAVYRAFENNLNSYRIGGFEGDSRMVQVAEKTIPLKTPKNREVFHELDLEPLVGGRKPGVYRVTLNNAEQYVAVTDMALQAVEDARSGKVVVFVRSLATGKPVAGARIDVMSFKNQLAASGVSDENGVAALAYDPAWQKESDRTVAVIAHKEGDISYFKLRDARTFDDANEAVVPNAPRAFVFAERGIARPGEKFVASAFLRREQGGAFRPMADTPLEVQLVDPSGDKMFGRVAKSDKYGFAQIEFELPDTAATGVYTVACRAAGSKDVCGRTFIRVASYVPDRIRVTGKSLTENADVDGMLEFEFDAGYYFGAPLENGSYRYNVASIPAPRPAHWDKTWSVGDAERFAAAAAFEGKGAKGKGGVKIQYPGFAVQGGRAFDPVRIVAEFEAAEPGGRAVTGRVVKDLWPTPFFIGLREAGDNGREKRFEYTLLPAAKRDSFPVANDLELTFELSRKEWEYVLARDGGRWKREWVRREIPLPDRRKIVSIPAGEFAVGKAETVAWDLPSGEYILSVASGDGLRTRLDFSWYAGDGGERSADPKSIYFRTDAEQVVPGGTVGFSFDAAGDGEAFLVYGERSLSGYRTLPVKAGRNNFSLPVPRDIHSSSFFIGCTVVVRRGGEHHRSFGMLKVKVDQSAAHRLQVALKHADGAEPEAQLPIAVTLKDAAGRPRSGAVALYAVDSGVVSLTGYKAPDIYGRFFGEIGCPMTFYDMYGLIFEELRITPDGRIGGDAAAAAAAKLGNIRQKHTVRLIAPLVRVPDSGTATVTVKLPDHTGELTFFAVASSEDAVGSTQSPVVMRKPVTVAISAPRYIAPGDTAELAFTVFNHEAKTADCRCVVTLPPALKPVDGASNVLIGKALSKGEQRTFTLKVRAGENFGAGTISAHLNLGDAAAKDETFVTVRSVNVAQCSYRFAALKPGESFKAEFADDYIGSPAGTIRLSASPALAVKNAVEWLNAYPYGCLEQTTAGAFPFLSLPTLAKVGLIDKALADTNRHKVAGAYAKLLAMSLSDGSFAMWPGGREPWTEATVFALHFVFEAERRGMLSPDAAKRQKHIEWLRRLADDASPKVRPLRAYACYVLAVAGDRSFVAPARNLIEATEKPDYALLLAGGALVKGGYAGLGAPAMRDALAARCWREPGVPTGYSDDACRLGMALYILSDCALPDDGVPTRLALELARSIRKNGSAWGTTQANAWAALGLAAYAEKYPPSPARAEVALGKDREDTTFSGVRTLPAKNGTEVVNRGGGLLIVESSIRGIPRRTPPNGGAIALSKEYLNEKGEAVTSVAHGEKVLVRIRFESPEPIENLVVADLLPAGLEIEDELLAGRAANLPGTAEPKYGALRPKRLEKRDDRFLVFGDAGRGRSEVTYRTRAVIRGSFVIPPVHAEAMYKPDVNGIFGMPGVFTVR